jgi:protein TonB
MSPTAVALAVLLHAMVLLALWWLAQHLPKDDFDDAIQVSFEEVKPPPPPPPKPPEQPKPEAKQQPKPEPKPDPKPEPKPQPQLIDALKPPAPITADKATQVPPQGDKPKDAQLAPPPPPVVDSLPAPEPDPPAPTAAEIAKMEPPAAPEPAPAQEAKPAPPAQTGDLPKPPPPPAPAQPQQQALAAPPSAPKPLPPAHPMPQLRKPDYQPSPLSLAPAYRPPAGTRSQGDPSPSPFVNPADSYNRARAADNYLWQVARKLQGYRYNAQVNVSEGITVVRVVIARDGRLLNVAVTRSSGIPQFDQGVLAGVRSGSPYAPLPPDIIGDSASFDLPLVSVSRGR